MFALSMVSTGRRTRPVLFFLEQWGKHCKNQGLTIFSSWSTSRLGSASSFGRWVRQIRRETQHLSSGGHFEQLHACLCSVLFLHLRLSCLNLTLRQSLRGSLCYHEATWSSSLGPATLACATVLGILDPFSSHFFVPEIEMILIRDLMKKDIVLLFGHTLCPKKCWSPRAKDKKLKLLHLLRYRLEVFAVDLDKLSMFDIYSGEADSLFFKQSTLATHRQWHNKVIED